MLTNKLLIKYRDEGLPVIHGWFSSRNLELYEWIDQVQNSFGMRGGG